MGRGLGRGVGKSLGISLLLAHRFVQPSHHCSRLQACMHACTTHHPIPSHPTHTNPHRSRNGCPCSSRSAVACMSPRNMAASMESGCLVSVARVVWNSLHGRQPATRWLRNAQNAWAARCTQLVQDGCKDSNGQAEAAGPCCQPGSAVQGGRVGSLQGASTGLAMAPRPGGLAAVACILIKTHLPPTLRTISSSLAAIAAEPAQVGRQAVGLDRSQLPQQPGSQGSGWEAVAAVRWRRAVEPATVAARGRATAQLALRSMKTVYHHLLSPCRT